MFPPQILTITEAQADFTGILAYACTIPGTILCFFVLVAYATAACIPASRPHLDRVSFRLLTYAIVFNVLYGIAFSVTASRTGPGPVCNFGAFAVNFTLSFSTFFTSCIALNLQLVLVHNINGRTMEKYYVIGTTVLSLALTVPAYALDQFGWDVANSTCWFKNPNDTLRLHWLIGTQSFWILFVATGETICSIVVLFYMFRFEMNSRNLRKGSQSTYGHSTGMKSSSSRTIDQASQYRNIILRIGLYPLVSMFVNYSTSILDVYQTVKGVHTELDFRLLVLDLVLYGFRTAAYASLAMFDPSFVRAVRAVRESRQRPSQDHSATMKSSRPQFIATGSTTGMTSTQGQLTINIELEQVTQSDEAGDKSVGFGESYHQHGAKPGSDIRHNGVHVVSGTPPMMDPAGDAAWRAQANRDMEVENSRNFQRQL